MPKTLQNPPPSSAVVRLFDGSAAANAVASAPIQPSQHRPMTEAAEPRASETDASNHPKQKRDMVLTETTARTLDRLISLFRDTTRTRLNRSHVMRAVLIAIDHAFDTLEDEARNIGPLKLPSNAIERAAERERFELLLAASIVAGMRASALMKAG